MPTYRPWMFGSLAFATVSAVAWITATIAPYLFPPIEKRTIAECFNLTAVYRATADFRLAPPALLNSIARDRSAESWRAEGEAADNGLWHVACSAYLRAAAAYAARGDVDAKNTWGNHGLAAEHEVETSYLRDVWQRPITKPRISNGSTTAQTAPPGDAARRPVPR